jgi:hypothetical protein
MIAAQTAQCAWEGSYAGQQLVGRTTTGQTLVICEISKDTQFRLPKEMTFVDACENASQAMKDQRAQVMYHFIE